MRIKLHLQQSPTFWKLPGEFVMLFDIACLTRQHKIAHVISRDARSYYTAKGKCVLDLIKVLPLSILLDPFELRKAAGSIIATIVLALQLLSDLSRSMCALYLGFTGTSSM